VLTLPLRLRRFFGNIILISPSMRDPSSSRCLDEVGLDPNCRAPPLDLVALPGSQATPLHVAVCGGGTKAHLEVVVLLLERGADVEARDRDGR
jgi:hypothetical protein